MKINRSNMYHWILLAQQAFFTMLIIMVRPFFKKKPKPVVVLYGHQFSGNLQALYKQWQQTHQSRLDLYFLTLDPEHAQKIRQEGLNILQCNRLNDMLTLAQASAIITDHGLHTMQPLVNFTDIRFIDVWHGIPFKGFVADDFTLQHHYDEVWVSSPMIAKLYCEKLGFDPARVLSLGYARTDQLFNASKYQDKPEALKVLYAPTWHQDNCGRELFPFDESAENFLKKLAECCQDEGATLMVRSHLNSEIAEVLHPNVAFFPQQQYPDTERLLLEADVLICDWSSIAFDFLALNKPTIFLDVTPPFKNGMTLDSSYRFGKIVTSMEELESNLKLYIEKPSAYINEFSATHSKIARLVYGSNTAGNTATKQLSRLVDLCSMD
jgi:CDP-glycerol glycerophosphotransferase (TagB/SpsB family)